MKALRSLLLFIAFSVAAVSSSAEFLPAEPQTVTCAYVGPGLISITTTSPEYSAVLSEDLVETIEADPLFSGGQWYWVDGQPNAYFHEDSARLRVSAMRFRPMSGATKIQLRQAPSFDTRAIEAVGRHRASSAEVTSLTVPAKLDAVIAALKALRSPVVSAVGLSESSAAGEAP